MLLLGKFHFISQGLYFFTMDIRIYAKLQDPYILKHSLYSQAFIRFNFLFFFVN